MSNAAGPRCSESGLFQSHASRTSLDGVKRLALSLVTLGCVATAGLTASVVLAQEASVQAATADESRLILKKYGRRTGLWLKPAQAAAVASFDEEVSVDVERGALSGLTHITVQRIIGHRDTRVGTHTYDFGPRGQVFAEPVTICFDNNEVIKSAVAGKTACLGYFDEHDKAWVCEDACLEVDKGGKVCGTTDHFTNFAVLLEGGGGKERCRQPDDDWTGAAATRR